MNLTKKEERMVWMFVKLLKSEADLMSGEVFTLLKDLTPVISKQSGVSAVHQDELTEEDACPLALELMKIKNTFVKLRAYVGDIGSRLEV